MARAGLFIDRLQWQQRSPGTPDTFGERQPTYAVQGYLWCAIEDLGASRSTDKLSEKQLSTATVRIRNYPDVVAGDRLYDPIRAQTWTVKTVTAGDNEIACAVER